MWSPLERLKEAHALHHRFGGEPYGMLCPVIPRQLRERAALADARAAVRVGRRATPVQEVAAAGTTGSSSPVVMS